MVGWLVARWFLGGEMVGGEIPWWRDDRIPNITYPKPKILVKSTALFGKSIQSSLSFPYCT